MKRALLAASLVFAALATAASAQGPSPYDMTFKVRGSADVPMRADMSEGAAVTGTLPAGARGIVLRWCRSEIPFGSWQFGSVKQQLALLDQRWCEISHDGKVGNVPGSAIAPE